MKTYERRAYVHVTAEDASHAAAMFELIDGAEIDTISAVPGYGGTIHLEDGEPEEVEEEPMRNRLLRLVPHLSRVK